MCHFGYVSGEIGSRGACHTFQPINCPIAQPKFHLRRIWGMGSSGRFEILGVILIGGLFFGVRVWIWVLGTIMGRPIGGKSKVASNY